MHSKELHIIKWPDNFQHLVFESINNDQDRFVADISVSYAERYIEKYRGNSSYDHKIAVLEYLLFQVKFGNYKRYIYSNELISWLEQNYINYSEEDFRREIIGHLRDEGVVIAGSRKGLKIPMSLEELVDYLSYTSSRYLTMIKRFKETYKTLNASSLGNIDIFNSKEFEIHKEIFKILDKY